MTHWEVTSRGNSLDNRQELLEFLMDGLADTYSDFDDDSTFAFAVAANIAIIGNSIPESIASMYLVPVIKLIDESIVKSSIAYFHGAQILHIQCDCSDPSYDCLVDNIENNELYQFWFEKGKTDSINGSLMYNKAVTDVTALREILF